jgi:hypothetical protein
MKVLWLCNSNDDTRRPGVEKGLRRPEVMVARLAADLGEPVDLVVKPAMPSPEFPAIVARRMEEEAPDVVWLNVANYWINYESTPLKVKRWLGRLGEGPARVGFKVADRFAEHRSYRGLRQLIQRTIGGDPRFTPAEVLASVEAAARQVIRDESRILIIEGPRDRVRFYGAGRAASRMERRRQWLHRELRDLAGSMHCAYYGSDEPLRRQLRNLSLGKDAFHMDSRGHAASAEFDYEALRNAVLAGRGEPAPPLSRGTI